MTSPINDEKLSAAVEKVAAAADAGRLTDGSMQNLNRWLTEPQYRRYVPAIVKLIEAEQFDELDTLFWEVIPFGTGGRRGTMTDFGSATINERTIAESAHGLAEYIKSTGRQNADGTPASVVIAHDSRNRSEEFTRLTATTLAAHGLKVFVFDGNRSTPALSFAVRHLRCDAGVVITASHNPPSDNGFKAYWSTGGQVLPPHDKGIIDCVYRAGEIPTVDFDAAVSAGKIVVLGDDVDRAYVEAASALSLSSSRSARALFSPLHGVGETSIVPVLQAAGFDGVETFEPHREPNGNFPNVPDHLPNPERPEVFQPALPRAREIDADLVIASDPDADRIGAVVRDASGEYRYLTGNRIGALVVDFILRKRAAAGTLTPEHYVVETLVTTPLIAAIARSRNVRVIDDLLVGFKYIGRTMDQEGPDKFVFGAEESLGYLAGEYARDKDAAIGALYLLEHASELRDEGKTLWDRLDELFVEHGCHVEGQISKFCRGASGRDQIGSLLTAFREAPPSSFGGAPLARVRDYRRHEVRSLPDNARMADLPNPSDDLLFFDSVEGDCEYHIAVRPSGTEPKIKFYTFVKQTCPDRNQLEAVKRTAEQFLANLQQELSTWVDAHLG